MPRRRRKKGEPAGPFHKTQTALAEALGRSVGWVTMSKRKKGFPQKTDQGWDEAAICRWIDAQPAGRNQKPPPDRTAPSSRPTSPSPAPEPFEISERAEEQLLAIAAGEDPVTVCRAAMKLGATRLADAYRRGSQLSRELPDLIKALNALRHAEAAAIKLDEQRGQLVSIDVARVAGASLAQAFVRALTAFETSVGAKVEEWLSDENLRKVGTKERQRKIREWVRDQGREVRELARGDLVRVMDEAAEESRAAKTRRGRR